MALLYPTVDSESAFRLAAVIKRTTAPENIDADPDIGFQKFPSDGRCLWIFLRFRMNPLIAEGRGQSGGPRWISGIGFPEVAEFRLVAVGDIADNV